MASLCKKTKEHPRMETRMQKVTVAENGDETVSNCLEARVYSSAFDTGWVDVSVNARAAEDKWEITNPPLPEQSFGIKVGNT